ncbi:MAG: MFS transporter, partial [Trueperaceae bacterium]
LLGAAAGCFLGATASFARIREEPGHAKGGRNALQEARVGVRLLRDVPGFRAFVTARALLLAVPLALPFLTVFGREHVDATLGGLGIFVAANALAASLASPAWGRAADMAAHRTMALGGAVSLLAVAWAFALAWGPVPDEWRTAWAYVPAYLLAGVGYAGVRLGRKTYLVDAPPKDDRPTWVAVANTAIGGATALGAAIGLTAAWWGASGTLVAFSALTVIGCVAAWRLPAAADLRARAEGERAEGEPT